MFDGVKNIVRQSAANSSEFVVETESGGFEWRTLPLDDGKVKTFLEQQAELSDSLPVVNAAAWADGGELIDDESVSDDSNE